MQKKSKEYLLGRALGTLIVGVLGASASWATSSPRSSFKKRIPNEKIKNIDILPNLIIEEKNKDIHIHHWFYLSFFYISIVMVKKGFPASRFVKAFVLGSIIQGLSYNDRLKLREKSHSLGE